MGRRLVITTLSLFVALTSTAMATMSSPASETSAQSVVRYVSFGDSVTTVTPSFVDMVAKGAGAALHRKVVVTKVVEDGDVSVLVGRLKADAALRTAVRSADLITITIGANEIGAALDRIGNKTCGGSDGSQCVRTAEKGFERSYRALLDQLTKLRPRAKAAYRLLTSFNTPAAFPPELGKPFTAAVRAENTFVCAQAARRSMKCPDVYAAFNGADGSRDPLTTGLVIQDGHPTAKGSALIAKVVVAAGFAPLR
jgi:lysophospholipase L1-like esterase